MSYRFAIISCGNIALRHAEQVQAVDELLGLCDTDTSKADYLAERYQVKAFMVKQNGCNNSSVAKLEKGLFFTQFSHFIDILYWFLGEIDRVSGFRGNYLHRSWMDFKDFGTASIIMKKGVHFNETHEQG